MRREIAPWEIGIKMAAICPPCVLRSQQSKLCVSYMREEGLFVCVCVCVYLYVKKGRIGILFSKAKKAQNFSSASNPVQLKGLSLVRATKGRPKQAALPLWPPHPFGRKGKLG